MRDALAPFYAALSTASSKTVTVLHYGDSPTTADLITGDVRSLLQQRFGDAGHGYLLPAKPWAWYGHRDTDLSDHDWDILNATQSKPGNTSAWGAHARKAAPAPAPNIALKGAGQSAVELDYLQQPAAAPSLFPPTAPSSPPSKPPPTANLPRGKPSISPSRPSPSTSNPRPPTSRSSRILHDAAPRILYDSLGLNGAFTSVLSSAMSPAYGPKSSNITTPS